MVLNPTTQKQTGKRAYRPPQQGEWTYQDYLRLPDNEFRYEVLYGELYMSPAPLIQHQRIIFALIKQFAIYLDKHPLGEVLPAPVDVHLIHHNSVVQPDLLFVAQENQHIVQEKVVAGAPDVMIEVISPGTINQDRHIKYQLYAAAGVREYWLIDPKSCAIEIYVLRGQAYALLGMYHPGDRTESEVLPGFSVAVNDVCTQTNIR